MTPHPIPRRPSFGLGILILLLLTTAWLRSSFYRDEASMPVLCVANQLGQISFRVDTDTRGQVTYFTSDAIYPRRPWFPYPFSFIKFPAGAIKIGFAHWFLILLTLIAWITLFNRHRRQLRLLTEMEKTAEAETKTDAEADTTRPA